MADFKPNIYPVMYWALAYGALAGVLLFVVFLLSQYITVIWFPVFLVGLIFGGFRNYRTQKRAFEQGQGLPLQSKPVMQEFREAISDITTASQEMMAEQSAEDQAAAQTNVEQPPAPPLPPTPPQPPLPPQ
ncbi:MAG: hypothetical protein HYR90_03775 [Candidatus Andersenbacteria bacterium]|nr:hypothetical protein [Candidatus Andersenbacteria bacterium]MBI3250381.1 hypothetical protein [Candidatus Andersenbacteria bacterium]